MTSKEVLASFSETLLNDARILSAPERELLVNLLQVARAHAQADGPVTEIIAHAIGETIAKRAFNVLGGQVIEQILRDSAADTQNHPIVIAGGPRPPKSALTSLTSQFGGGSRPQPSPGPGMSTVAAGPRPQPSPGPGMTTIASGPRPPKASTNSDLANFQHKQSVAVLEQPEFMPAQLVVLDEFLVPEELNALTEYALSHEADFVLSEVIAPANGGSSVDYEHRRSRVLMDMGEHQAMIVNRIQACLPSVLAKLGHGDFSLSRVEAQITASNDGDFFRHHNDNGQGEIASRELTFVYFFHREPKAFMGGELRIYDSRLENGDWLSTGEYRSIVPQQNQIVFFPSSLLHEITPVECPSKAFADSRFTVNGWFHR